MRYSFAALFRKRTKLRFSADDNKVKFVQVRIVCVPVCVYILYSDDNNHLTSLRRRRHHHHQTVVHNDERKNRQKYIHIYSIKRKPNKENRR